MDLQEAREQVREVLDNVEFREGLRQLILKERRIIHASRPHFGTQSITEDNSLIELLATDAALIREGRLRSFIIERAINHLPRPLLITQDELEELAFHHLSGVKKDLETLFERFLNFALLRIQSVATGPRFSLGDWHVAGTENEYESPYIPYGYTEYCSLPNGYDLYIEWEIDNKSWQTPVDGWIYGSCTESAVSQTSAEIETTIQTLVRLWKLAATSREKQEVREFVSKSLPVSDIAGEEETDYEDFTPAFSWLLAIRPQIALALKCHYSNSAFASRINHAVTLAQCADAHPNDAIAISFCVSAIEALLCEGTEDKGDQLRKRIPAILQFQGKGKEFRSIYKAIISLYDIRSQAVHGSRLRATQEQLQSATRLLAAILRGVLEWAVHTADESALPEDQEWIAELRKITSDPKNPGKLSGVTNELSEHVNFFVKSFEIDHE